MQKEEMPIKRVNNDQIELHYELDNFEEMFYELYDGYSIRKFYVKTLLQNELYVIIDNYLKYSSFILNRNIKAEFKINGNKEII